MLILQKNYIKEEINLDNFNYITLKTSSGKWLKPNKILLSENIYNIIFENL